MQLLFLQRIEELTAQKCIKICACQPLQKWYRDLGGILPRSRQDSRRDPAEILAAEIPGSRRDSYRDSWREGGIPGGQNLGGIPAGILPGFLAGGGIPGGKISAGSRRDPGGNLAGILGGRRDSRRPKSRRDPGGNLAGILGGRRDSRRPKSRQDPGGNLAGILGGKRDPGGQNLGRIPAGVLPGFLAGNRTSRWECCRDLQRETKFIAVKIFPAAKISGGPVWNLAGIRDENHN